MNKLSLLFSLVFVSFFAISFGQESTQKPTTEYPALEKRLSKMQSDLQNPKKNVQAKTFLSYAELLMDIYNVNAKYIESAGGQLVTLRYNFGNEKEVRNETIDGNNFETYVFDRVNVVFQNGAYLKYEETSKIFDNPLPEALTALNKANELDSDKKLESKIVETYKLLADFYSHEAGRFFYDNEDYKNAFLFFSNSVKIHELPVMKDVAVDTGIIYNTGIMASMAGMIDESIEYFEKAIKYNYPEPRAYIYLKQKYFEKEDTTKGMEILFNGFDKFPGDQDIIREMISYYITINKSEEALNYIKMAQEKDPTDVALLFAEGALYDQNGERDKALDVYKRCIEINPDYLNAYYNTGVLYYNSGIEFNNNASNERDDKKYNELIAKRDAEFKKVIDPMTNCVRILEGKATQTSDEIETLSGVYETLRSVYRYLKMNDKYEEINAKLKAL